MASCAVPTFDAQLVPSGSHPTLRLTLPHSLTPSTCPIFLHLRVPPSIILDRYQLSQLHEEGRLGAPTNSSAVGPSSFLAVGEADLELPESRTRGADVLVRLRAGAKGKGKAREVATEFELPLHARYLTPRESRWTATGERQDSVEVEVNWPRVFYGCTPDQPSPALMGCPPSTLPDSLSSQFGPRNRLYFLNPSPHNLPVKRSPHCPPAPPSDSPLVLSLPTGVSSDLPWVELVTVAVVWFGAAWVGWRGWAAARRGAGRKVKVD